MYKTIIFCFIFAVSAFAQLNPVVKRMADSVSKNNLISHIKTLEFAGGHYSRVNLTPGNDSGVFYIKRQFEKIPGLTVKLDTFYISSASSPYNLRPIYNVVAELKGKKYPNQYYVLGAHHDCSASRMGSTIWNAQWNTIKAPGADDNATGIAAIIEIARIMADTSFNFNNDYTIKFVAFGAEESGIVYSDHHYGSKYFANNAAVRGDSILGMVSIDMIGYNNNYNFNAIVADNNSITFADKFKQANVNYSIGMLLNSTYVVASYSDHQSFWDKGYKAILFIENAPPWNNGTYYTINNFYHTSSDSFGTVNMELVRKVTKLNLVTIGSLTATPTDINENQITPSNYTLSQNYPNPFNPSTTINYSIPASGNVVLEVYDYLGNRIAVPINEFQNSGSYSFTFSPEGLSSGVYFYRIKSGNFSETKKMVYLK